MSVSGDSGTLFTGFTPVESAHSGEAFNPCPLPAPSLHSSPLYMDMFYFHSSFLLAALSVAQQGTNSLFNRYLFGQWEKSHIFEQPPPPLCPPPAQISLSQTLKLIFITHFLLLSCWVIPHSHVSPSETDSSRENGQKAASLAFSISDVTMVFQIGVCLIEYPFIWNILKPFMYCLRYPMVPFCSSQNEE